MEAMLGLPQLLRDLEVQSTSGRYGTSKVS